MSVTFVAQFQARSDTAANWTSANPTLKLGEPGFESDTNKLKIGDGSTAWTTLPYVTGGGGGGGATGPTGMPGIGQDGEEGAQGIPGLPGAAGAAGATGATGSTGATGPTGPAGLPMPMAGQDGEDGMQGIPGAAGAAGATGATGSAGSNGTIGSNGADGRPGQDGDDGSDGFTVPPVSFPNSAVRTLTVTFGDGVNVPAANTKAYIARMPTAGNITSWSVTADASGSATIDVQKATASATPSFASIVGGGTKPGISSAQASVGNAPASWAGTGFSATDMLMFNLSTIATCKRVVLNLEYTAS